MKRGTPDHPKMLKLARMLGIPQAYAVGLMEMLWHWASKYAIQGDVGKWSDDVISAGAGWTDQEKIQVFIDSLVQSGWLDVDDDHRLLVHDWSDHADESVRKTLKNRGLEIFQKRSGKVEKVSGKVEKESAPACAFPVPLPEPEPLPEPKPVPVPCSEPTRALQPLRFGTWQMDETYTPFVEMYRASGAPISDDDILDAHHVWKTLDFDQKRDRCARFASGIDAQEWSDVRFIPKPRKFLVSTYKRPAPPSQKTAYERKQEETLRLFRERMAENA